MSVSPLLSPQIAPREISNYSCRPRSRCEQVTFLAIGLIGIVAVVALAYEAKKAPLQKDKNILLILDGLLLLGVGFCFAKACCCGAPPPPVLPVPEEESRL